MSVSATKNLINVYSTHRNPPPLNFQHQLHARRDRTDPELREHLHGFIGFVLQGGRRDMTQSLYHVYRHIERVQHHLSIEVPDSELQKFSEWARQANAICFHTDSTVRDPHGNVLVHPRTGEADRGCDVPYPEEAELRKERTTANLLKLGVNVNQTLPPVVGEAEVCLQEAQAVFARAQALAVVALRGESLANDEGLSVSEIKQKMAAAFNYLSPLESQFVNSSNPDKQQIINAVWRYEALATLEWSLGLIAELPFPSQICDVPLVMKSMIAAIQDTNFKPALRPASEILDCLDLHFRLHNAVRQAQINGETMSLKIEPGVVVERHYALNWLTSFEEAEWDQVDTPT